MQVTFNERYTIDVDEASESFVNHQRKFWCKINNAVAFDLELFSNNFFNGIESDNVTHIVGKDDSGNILFTINNTVFASPEINKFYQPDAASFVTMSFSKLRNLAIPVEE